MSTMHYISYLLHLQKLSITFQSFDTEIVSNQPTFIKKTNQEKTGLYLFIKALQHKYWRSVGHQVLQPAKEIEFGTIIIMLEKLQAGEKIHDALRQPWTCSHLIYAKPLTGVWSLSYNFIIPYRDSWQLYSDLW